MHASGLAERDRPGHAAHVARVREVRPGLCVHADDAVDEFDALMTGRCAAGLHLVLLLEGWLDLRYGDRRVLLSTEEPRMVQDLSRAKVNRGQSFLMHLIEPEAFGRRIRKGGYARRLSLGMSAQWLADLQAATRAEMPDHLHALLSGHLSMRFWQPTARAVALAEQIVRPPAYQPMLQAIYLESRVLDLLGEALASTGVCAPRTPEAKLASRTYRRMAELRAFLGSGEIHALSLDDIARHMGMNANTLQRQFRSIYGTTVFDFLRESCLQRARQALERDAISVKQAAALAGYSSAANFATAYKRRFGLTPRLAQRTGQR